MCWNGSSGGPRLPTPMLHAALLAPTSWMQLYDRATHWASPAITRMPVLPIWLPGQWRNIVTDGHHWIRHQAQTLFLRLPAPLSTRGHTGRGLTALEPLLGQSIATRWKASYTSTSANYRKRR